MGRTRSRYLRACAALLLLGLMVLLGTACRATGGRQKGKRETPLPKDVEPNDVVDVDFADDPADPLGPLDGAEITKAFLLRRAEAARERREREEKATKRLGVTYKQREYNILVVSGGGVFGAYPAGILCGWTAACKSPAEGGRPVFDVVTGVSTGALVAPLAFLGPEHDETLRTFYTGLTKDDIFKIRRSVRSFFAESLADNTPLRKQLVRVISPAVVAQIAVAHKAGRRLYIGTTNLDTRRLVVWDIGAIAAKGGPDAIPLIHKIMLASAAIPGFFPSERFDVTIDGKPFEEMHVDGGVTRSMFFRPPYIPPEDVVAESAGPNALAGSNLFALVAGKAYPDAEGVRARTVAVVGASISNLLYVTSRNDLFRFYTYSMLSGMDFFTAAIPSDLEVTNSSTNFDPKETIKMFNEGFRLAKEGAFTKAPKADPKSEAKPPKPLSYADGAPILFKEPGPAWRNTPPGVAAGERGRNRAGLTLVVKEPAEARPKGRDQNPGGPPPVVK